MSEPYYRSPLIAWLLSVFTLGLALLWLIPRFGRDLNQLAGHRAIDVSLSTTLIWLLFGAHLILTAAIMGAKSSGVDLHTGYGAGLGAARQVIDAAWLLSLLYGLRVVHLRLSDELGEQTGLLSPAFIVALTVALGSSIPYLQDRLNSLAKAPRLQEPDGTGPP